MSDGNGFRVQRNLHRIPILSPINIWSCSMLRCRDPHGSRPVQERVADLVKRMTLDEKIQQLQAAWSFDISDGTSVLGKHRANKRLGIPVLIPGEGLHGVMVWPGMEGQPTSFPQAIAMGSTWDPDLVERVATAIAKEARAMGIHQLYAPVLDVARDPRLGRTEECYGEDPYLVARFGVAFILGLQGRGSDRLNCEHVLATAKHFSGYHDGARGINGAAAEIPERTMWEVHFPPFEAAVREAKIASIMPAHTDVNGVPCHANVWLLEEVLREAWGFEGFVVSDNRDVGRLKDMHGVADTYEKAAALALAAGCDQEISMQQSAVRCYADPLVSAIKKGDIDESIIDRSVRRILTAKFQLGLFNATEEHVPNKSSLNTIEHRRLALDVARKAAVLLKNDGPLLPLDLTSLGSIAVIGPNAAVPVLGGYTGKTATPTITVLDGIRKLVGARTQVRYAQGCSLEPSQTSLAKLHKSSDLSSRQQNLELAVDDSLEGFDDAIEIARRSDVAIVVLGDNAWTCGEGVDRDEIGLPGAQQPLLESLHATGTPVILVLLNGRPPDLRWAADHIPAIIEGWCLGNEGGQAVAEIVFGHCNPSGKLTISFPRSVGQIPVSYRERASFTGSGSGQYRGVDKTALFPFGHGLSYTRFIYDNIRVEPATFSTDEEAEVSVDVANIGHRHGDEILQFYVRDHTASVTRPLMELKGFQRVSLAVGEKRTVSFKVGFGELSFYDRNCVPIVEPGRFSLMIGSSSVDYQIADIEVSLP